MKYTISFITLVILSSSVMYAQTAPKEYMDWVRKADSLYKIGNYAGSGKTYSLAFKSFGGKGYVPDRYQAARGHLRGYRIVHSFISKELHKEVTFQIMSR